MKSKNAQKKRKHGTLLRVKEGVKSDRSNKNGKVSGKSVFQPIWSTGKK
jgi:hypothetical protein